MADESATSLPLPRATYERLARNILFGGLAVCAVGLLAVAIFKAHPVASAVVASGGLAAAAIGLYLTHPLSHLRTLVPADSGGASYDLQRHWQRYRAYLVCLHVFTLAATFLLVGSTAVRHGWLRLIPDQGIPRAVSLFGAVLVATVWLVARDALRQPIPRPATRGETWGVRGLIGAMLTFAVLAPIVAAADLRIAGLLELRRGDAPFLLMAGLAAASFAASLSRRVPWLHLLLLRRAEAPSPDESRNRAVVLPSLAALLLLSLVLLTATLLETGLGGFLQLFRSHTLLVVALVLTVAALATGLSVSTVLIRNEGRHKLFQQRRTRPQRTELTIITASATSAAILLLTALWLVSGHAIPSLRLESQHWIHLLSFAVLAATGPYGFYYGHRLRRVRRLEERFPDFLRDLAASRRAGLTLPAATTLASNGQYGELSPEIRKMADQLQLNLPFDEALRRLGERVDTPLIQRDVLLITEASRAGGQITDVLEAAADDAREIKTLENDRRQTMRLYTAVVYIIFAVFLLVIGILYASFIPPFLRAVEAAKGAAGDFASLIPQDISAQDFRAFYFTAALVQAVGNGFIAGLLESGKALAGLRHTCIMGAVTWIAFRFFLGVPT